MLDNINLDFIFKNNELYELHCHRLGLSIIGVIDDILKKIFLGSVFCKFIELKIGNFDYIKLYLDSFVELVEEVDKCFFRVSIFGCINSELLYTDILYNYIPCSIVNFFGKKQKMERAILILETNILRFTEKLLESRNLCKVFYNVEETNKFNVKFENFTSVEGYLKTFIRWLDVKDRKYYLVFVFCHVLCNIVDYKYKLLYSDDFCNYKEYDHVNLDLTDLYVEPHMLIFLKSLTHLMINSIDCTSVYINIYDFCIWYFDFESSEKKFFISSNLKKKCLMIS